MKILAACAAFAILAGCASDFSTERWQTESSRAYPAHPPAEVLAAAERLFVLSDGNDYEFIYPDLDGVLMATRGSGNFQFMGVPTIVDHWIVVAEPEGAGAAARVGLKRGSTLKDVQITPDVYEFFWARMDHLLGERATWLECTDHSMPMFWGESLDVFCDASQKDDRPEHG